VCLLMLDKKYETNFGEGPFSAGYVPDSARQVD
jgi:hypothetical protein